MIEIEKLSEIPCIDVDRPVRLKLTGNVSQIMAYDRLSRGGTTIKLDRDTYYDKISGEVREFHHGDSRMSDRSSVVKSLTRLRDIINTNVTESFKCRWLTLTYKRNETDSKRVYADFQRFNRVVRRVYGHYEYIACIEPQARGAWHLHVILIFPGPAPYMANSEVAALWGQGFVKIQRLADVDNVGAYLTAYLSDMPIDDISPYDSVIDGNYRKLGGDFLSKTEGFENSNFVPKKIIKGSRLYMYPPGINIYRFSRGIRQPQVYTMPYEMAKEQVEAATPTYRKAIKIFDPDRNYQNTLVYEYYNKLRPDGQLKSCDNGGDFL